MKTDPKRLQLVRKIYNENAHAYMSNEEGIPAHRLRRFELFCSHLPTAGSILDLGFGGARDMRYFDDQGYKVFGVDISEEFVRLARESFGDAVCVGDIVDADCPVYDRRYDGIWCVASIVHLSVDESRGVFHNIIRSLVPGGVACVSAKYVDGDTHEGEVTSSSIPGISRPFTYFSKTDLEESIQSVGLTIVDMVIHPARPNGDRFISIICLRAGDRRNDV